MIPADKALERLKMGNARFVERQPTIHAITGDDQRSEVAMGQTPFAVILGCSDSRVPVEIIFDQGLGDLFVIRVAGNVVGPTVIGSIEFAAAQLGTRLVVVMGHSQCGAIESTFAALQAPSEDLSPSLESIVNRIRPSVDGLSGDGESLESRINAATIANVQQSVAQLKHGSTILESLIEEEGLRIVGANYTLLSGVVDFLDETATE